VSPNPSAPSLSPDSHGGVNLGLPDLTESLGRMISESAANTFAVTGANGLRLETPIGVPIPEARMACASAEVLREFGRHSSEFGAPGVAQFDDSLRQTFAPRRRFHVLAVASAEGLRTHGTS
jgi:hypothetical protein